ncbi:hypothetical protein DFH09DRAFT_1092216 [Mycena vulgaris]|nr:hypothetical protein DFH09DRAFT_1092216 [Mycena vulgaris]
MKQSDCCASHFKTVSHPEDGNNSYKNEDVHKRSANEGGVAPKKDQKKKQKVGTTAERLKTSDDNAPERDITINIVIYTTAEMKKGPKKREALNDSFMILSSSTSYYKFERTLLGKIGTLAKLGVPPEDDQVEIRFQIPCHVKNRLELDDIKSYKHMVTTTTKCKDPVVNLTVQLLMKKALSEAHYNVEGENLRTTSWMKAAEGYHIKESISEFMIDPAPNSAVPWFESQPKKMAKMARDYHDSIQHKDQPDKYGRMLATKIMLEKWDVWLSEHEFKKMEEMDKAITVEDLASALKLSNNGKAPGIDEIPYEFYKILDILV